MSFSTFIFFTLPSYDTPHPPQAATSPIRREVLLRPKFLSFFDIRRKVNNRYGYTSPLVGEVARRTGEESLFKVSTFLTKGLWNARNDA